MKQLIFYALLFLVPACDNFLDADPNKSEIVTDKVFDSDVTATAAMNGIYTLLSGNEETGLGGGREGINILAGLSANDLQNYSPNLNLSAFVQHSLRPQNLLVEKLWNSSYFIIYQANAVLEGVTNSGSLSLQVSQQLRGEALVIRALMYFYLVNVFGDVPLITSTNYHVNRLISRKPSTDIYELIKTDLLEAQKLFPDDDGGVDRGRPGNTTATALLARVYLYQKDYGNAQSQASVLIGDPQYELTPKVNIEQTFLLGSKETIWQLMSVSSNFNTTEGSVFIPNGAPYYFITDRLRLHFEADDLRPVNWISSVIRSSVTYYFPHKYKSYSKLPTAPFTEASIVVRLAEMYLIRAEARVLLNDPDGAKDDLNMIRNRAGLTNTTATTEAELLLAIENERWSELFAEYGHRWLDLKRTDRGIEVIGNGIIVEDLLYPVPAAEFQKNPNLGDQNNGY